MPEFVKSSDIPDAKVPFPFNAVSPSVTLTTELNNGDAITTYTNTIDNNHWESRIQLTPAAYGEYAPYTIIKDREEFIRLVLQMKPCQASDEDVKKISE